MCAHGCSCLGLTRWWYRVRARVRRYVNERGVDFFRIKEMADEQHAQIAAGIARADFNGTTPPPL